MPIPSCRCPQRSLPPHQKSPEPRGQILVIFAVALLALLFFVGLALDAGSVYVTYGQLKRAVDAAAVASANDFKRGGSVIRMGQAAHEVLALHNIDMTSVNLGVYICDADGDGVRDASLQTVSPQFYARCPNTQAPANEAPRKLVWIEAEQEAPLYFLSLLGFNNLDLNTNSIAEAAPVDVVIVLDVSESMGSASADYISDNYNPGSCNAANTCQPLRQAKDAAKALVDTLYPGYDRVSVVTFSSVAIVHPIANLSGNSVDLSDDMDAVKTVIDNIQLNDDADYAKMWTKWRYTPLGHELAFNPVNPEDRDGDGGDHDDPAVLGYSCPFTASPATDPVELADRFWQVGEVINGVDAPDPYGWGGVPCDRADRYDAYDWNEDGVYTDDDHNIAVSWLAAHDPDGGGPLSGTLAPLSTCTGCGIRVASNVLKSGGRPGSVWVMVFLSDGVANLSDTPYTGGVIPNQYPIGFCGGSLNTGYWPRVCIDNQFEPRYCIDSDSSTCPTGATIPASLPSLDYSVMDYARDMVDEAALTRSDNPYEPPGNEIAVYTIGLGQVSLGENLLRYMAAVGDDGDRTTDPCRGVTGLTSCGQYYYAPGGDDLLPIFEDIASRIYTRIAQ